MESQKGLSRDQVVKFHRQGYYFPVRVFDDWEVAEFRAHFDNFLAYNAERIKDLPPNRHDEVFAETHMFLRWVYRIVSHRNVLDAVESILGPDLLVWDTGWFTKMPGEKKYVSWHQDANYWGLQPPNVVTAWVALSESILENGCMRVVPGSHQTRLLPQRETYAKDNALSRGQEIAVEVDEAKAVDLILQPGQMSLHHVDIIHGSKANTSTKPRIGIAIRYITPEVVQDGVVRQFALLARGRDEFARFELFEPPKLDDPSANELQVECLRRMMINIMPK
jgi:ectoine hydroxylase-related dioxygenase (phytanoyl-CoA dioxygenase family)